MRFRKNVNAFYTVRFGINEKPKNLQGMFDITRFVVSRFFSAHFTILRLRIFLYRGCHYRGSLNRGYTVYPILVSL